MGSAEPQEDQVELQEQEKTLTWCEKWHVTLLLGVVMIGIPLLTILVYCLFSDLFTGTIPDAQYSKIWTYDSVDNWPPTFCRYGKRQSPIAINANPKNLFVKSELNFANYDKTFVASAINTNYSVQLTVPPAHAASLMGGGLVGVYTLRSITLHWSQNDTKGAEHVIEGYTYPLELMRQDKPCQIQLVHVKTGLSYEAALSQPDGLTIVTVFATVVDRIRERPTMAYLHTALNQIVRDGYDTTFYMTPEHFLPHSRREFYRYEGSLTVPKCQEAVIWTLLKEPIKIRRHLLTALRSLRGLDGFPIKNNYRPVQSLNERIIYERSSG